MVEQEGYRRGGNEFLSRLRGGKTESKPWEREEKGEYGQSTPVLGGAGHKEEKMKTEQLFLRQMMVKWKCFGPASAGQVQENGETKSVTVKLAGR